MNKLIMMAAAVAPSALTIENLPLGTAILSR